MLAFLSPSAFVMWTLTISGRTGSGGKPAGYFFGCHRESAAISPGDQIREAQLADPETPASDRRQEAQQRQPEGSVGGQHLRACAKKSCAGPQ